MTDSHNIIIRTTPKRLAAMIEFMDYQPTQGHHEAELNGFISDLNKALDVSIEDAIRERQEQC